MEELKRRLFNIADELVTIAKREGRSITISATFPHDSASIFIHDCDVDKDTEYSGKHTVHYCTKTTEEKVE
jgi:hypothetical protein